MVDVISLARHLRAEFPEPEPYVAVYDEMTNQLGFDPDQEVQRDCYAALMSMWNRSDWIVDNDIGAAKAAANEEVLFEEDAITITRINGNSVMATCWARGEDDERVIWF